MAAIHINPAHKGKFTALKKKTGKTTSQELHSSNPTTRKEANFARMAKRHFKPLQGGGFAGPAGLGNAVAGAPNINPGRPKLPGGLLGMLRRRKGAGQFNSGLAGTPVPPQNLSGTPAMPAAYKSGGVVGFDHYGASGCGRKK